jgi:tetratricopeptide (TPR) repeat protein
MGREFGLDALARASGLSRDELLEVLDEAMGERVVGDVPGSPGRLRFGHALIRDTLYDELTPARRLQLHKATGEALEAVYSADPEPHLAELAQQFFAAAPAGVADKALEYARRAGDRAVSQLAYEEAVRLFEMAMTLVEDPVVRCELLLALGDAQARAGDTPASKEAFREAAELAEGRALTGHLVRAALGYGGRLIWEVSRDDDYLVPLLERALAALGEADSTQRVRLLARLAGGPLRDATAAPEKRRSVAEEALEMARRIGDPSTLAYALSGYTGANHSPDYVPKQAAIATELIQVANEAGDLERAAEGHEHRVLALIELGEMEQARADFAAMAKLAGELRQPTYEWLVAVYRALMALLEGRLAEAEVLIADARALGRRAQGWNAVVTYRLQLFVLRREQGRLGEIEVLLRLSADEYPTYPIWRCALAQMGTELGHVDEAREMLDLLAEDGFAQVPFDEEWLVSMGLLAETAIALGDGERVSVLYSLLLPYGDRVAISYPEISTGAVARYLGLLAAAEEKWDDAERHFEHALQMNGRIGARSWLAHTESDYARMLLARGGSGDAERARVLAANAQSACRELGIQTYDERLTGP